MRWARVSAGDVVFDVVFTDDGQPFGVKRVQTVWSATGSASSNRMTEQVRKVIARAKEQLAEDEEEGAWTNLL